MNYSEWVSQVKDTEIREALAGNIPEDLKDAECPSLRMAVLSFSWAYSEQGFEYWHDIYFQLIQAALLLVAK